MLRRNLNLVILFLVNFSFICSTAFSYEVTKTRKKKGYVYINAGKDTGIKKKQKVCISNLKGKKITCGKVRRVKKKYSIIKVRKKKIRKIKKGYPVEIIGLDGAIAESGAQSTSIADGSRKSFAIRGLYLPGISSATYNKISYVPPKTGETVDTLWNSGDPQSLTIAAFGMEFDMPNIGVAVGFKFKSYKNFETEEDYDANNQDSFVVNTNTASSIGFYLDYFFITTGSSGSGLRLGAGLDVDISTVELKLVNKNDADEAINKDVYSVKSDLTVISLRLPVIYDINMGGFGINAGINLLIPVSGDTPTTSTTIDDANTASYTLEDKETAAQNDVIASLGHTKSSFGAELVIGTYFAF